MACCLVAACLMVPRIVLFVMYFATDYFRVYETWYWPLLGFFFMPFTTLAYMAAMLNNNNVVSGWWLVLVVVAAITDLSSNGSATRAKKETAQRQRVR